MLEKILLEQNLKKINYKNFLSNTELILHLLKYDPDISTQELIEACKIRNPKSKITNKDIAWYKSIARNCGEDVAYKRVIK